MLIDRLELLDKLCNQYFENQNNDKSTAITGKKIENEIANLRSRYSMEEIKRLLTPADKAMIEKLAVQCPFLKDGDIHFVSLLLVGLSSKATSILMNISLKNFYTKRARIVERIRKSDAPRQGHVHFKNNEFGIIPCFLFLQSPLRVLKGA